MENYRFHLAAEKMYQYVWHTFADKILEASKPLLQSTDAHLKASRYTLLMMLLSESLKLLHPFMPFVTEVIWKELGNESLLMVTQIEV
jgi:valyl-tRNA synthetase